MSSSPVRMRSPAMVMRTPPTSWREASAPPPSTTTASHIGSSMSFTPVHGRSFRSRSHEEKSVPPMIVMSSVSTAQAHHATVCFRRRRKNVRMMSASQSRASGSRSRRAVRRRKSKVEGRELRFEALREVRGAVGTIERRRLCAQRVFSSQLSTFNSQLLPHSRFSQPSWKSTSVNSERFTSGHT